MLGVVLSLVVLSSGAGGQASRQSTRHVPVVEDLVQLLQARPDLRVALEQIQFLLRQVSIQATERYLGCKQRVREAVNDKIGIEPPDGRLASGSALPTMPFEERNSDNEICSTSSGFCRSACLCHFHKCSEEIRGTSRPKGRCRLRLGYQSGRRQSLRYTVHRRRRLRRDYGQVLERSK